MDKPGNLDAWEGDPNAPFILTAKVRRSLITQWVGEAWEILTTQPQYKDTFKACFERTGALITADGTLDEKICPMKGLINYKVPPIPETVTGVNDLSGFIPVTAVNHDNVDVDPAVLRQQQELINNPEILLEEQEDDDELHLEEVLITEDIDATEDDDEAETTPLDAEDDAYNSWDQAVDGAKNSLPVRMEPIIDQQQLPKRLMQLNSFIFIFYQNEWEIARIHKRIQVATEPTFDIKFYFTNQWAVANLNPENYGKDNASSNKWFS